MKLGRIYKLTVQVGNKESDTVVITSPLTLNMSISRGVDDASNDAILSIKNLAPDTRALIFHDRIDFPVYRRVLLEAGYEGDNKMATIFSGNMAQAYSRRVGTEWETEIEAYSGYFSIRNDVAAFSLAPDYSLTDTIRNVIRSMSHVKQGVISQIDTTRTRHVSLQGSPYEILRGLADGKNVDVFIDNEKVYFLDRDAVVQAEQSLNIVSSETGLLGTPRRSGATLEFETLFEPNAKVGQMVTLNCEEPVYNGSYKVLSFRHAGIISGAFSGKLTTTWTVWANMTLKAVA